MGPETVGLTIQRLMPALGSRLSLKNSPQLPTFRAWNWNSNSLEPDRVTMLETPPDQVGGVSAIGRRLHLERLGGTNGREDVANLEAVLQEGGLGCRGATHAQVDGPWRRMD